MNEAPVVVIGGGPAGAAAAVTLAQGGRPVLIIERQRGPHDKVCGEFLSAGALAGLRPLGIDAGGLGAVPVRRVGLSGGGRHAEAELPFAAAGLSRRVLDEALLARAVACGAELRRGVTVRGLHPGVAVRTDAGEVAASAVILATGKHDVHGLARHAARLDPPWTGVKLQLRLRHDLADRVEVELFSGGYGGLQPIEDGRATLCLAGRRREVAAAGRDWPALRALLAARAPRLSALTEGAEPCWVRPLAVSGIPYGFLHRPEGDTLGVVRAGDQFAVIPSFCGDGIAIALASGAACGRAVLDGVAAETVHRALHSRFARSLRVAAFLGGLAGTDFGRALGVETARRCPPVLRWAAALTRVPVFARDHA